MFSVKHLILPFLVLVLIFAAIGISIVSVFARVETVRDREEYIAYKQLLMNSFQTQSDHVYDDITGDLLLLRDLFAGTGESEGAFDRESLIRTLTEQMIESQQSYDQIRFLDAEGIETFRMNNEEGKGRIVTSQDLQDKSDRYYFTESLRLDLGEVYISPLDLNVENGEIEVPHKPMIRFATAVRDEAGNLKGVVVLNYRASDMLDTLRNSFTVESTDENISLLDSNGFYLMNKKDPSGEFSFMFPEETSVSLAEEDEKLWSIVSSGEGTTVDDEELYIYRHMVPSSPNLEIVRREGDQDAGWVMLSSIPYRYFEKTIFPDNPAQKIIFLVVAFLDVAVAAGLVFFWNRRKRDLTAITERNRNLELVQRIAHLGFYTLDITQNVLHWSDEVFQMFGVDPDAFSGNYEAFLACVHPEDTEKIDKAFMDAL